MFERYTETARRVIFFARYEASQFGSPVIETEHLLLGVLREDRGLVNRFFESSAQVESIRAQIRTKTPTRNKISVSVDLPLSHECRRVLSYGAEEADRMKHRHIDSPHLLLGLMRESAGLAAHLMNSRGLNLDQMRAEVLAGLAVSKSSRPSSIEIVRLARVKDIFGSAEAVAALRSRIPPDAARREKIASDDLPLTEQSKRALSHADRERARRSDDVVGPFYLLVGLPEEEGCEAAEILRASGVTLERVRAALDFPPQHPEEGTNYV